MPILGDTLMHSCTAQLGAPITQHINTAYASTGLYHRYTVIEVTAIL